MPGNNLQLEIILKAFKTATIYPVQTKGNADWASLVITGPTVISYSLVNF